MEQEKNKRIRRFELATCVLFTVTIILFGCKGQRGESTEKKDYATLKVQPESRTLSTTYSATIQGRQDVEIYSQVSGTITEVRVEEGNTVRKGQTLFVIDQVPYRAALHTAEANVRAARAEVSDARLNYESRKELFAENVVSEFDLQTAANALETAEARLVQRMAEEEAAANNLSYTTVKSPSDGVVGTLPFRTGALVSSVSSRPLTTVSDNSEMWIYFSMNETRLLALTRKYGSMAKALAALPAVELLLSDGSTYSHSGRIQSISGVIDRTTGSVTLKAVFPNDERLLHSGSTGNILLPTSYENYIVIPQTATYELQDKRFVYKVVDGKAQSVEINVSPMENGQEFIVERGLKAGDVIVTEGVGTLHDGTLIAEGKENTL